MNLHTPSIIKAGGAAASLSLILGILSAIPFFGCLIAPIACLGGLLIPFGAGLGYGYLAPGKENMAEGIVGGLLAGLVSGLIYGLLYGVVSFATVDVSTAMFTFITSALGAGISGGFFGALGGAVWPQVQHQIEGR